MRLLIVQLLLLWLCWVGLLVASVGTLQRHQQQTRMLLEIHGTAHNAGEQGDKIIISQCMTNAM